MKRREETPREKALAKRMRIALNKEHGMLPEPKIVSKFRKETVRVSLNFPRRDDSKDIDR